MRGKRKAISAEKVIMSCVISVTIGDRERGKACTFSKGKEGTFKESVNRTC